MSIDLMLKIILLVNIIMGVIFLATCIITFLLYGIGNLQGKELYEAKKKIKYYEARNEELKKDIVILQCEINKIMEIKDDNKQKANM